ncbi:MAG: HAMP domain-containing histidine kinase [Gemmataceae bacterium]|nr:HAMP domain-containing histidine kinase [Gemmataceae bacterium]
MFKSLRVRALLFTVLFIFPFVVVTRIIQIEYIRFLIVSSIDEQIGIRLVLLGALMESGESIPSNKSNDHNGKGQVSLMERLLPADFFQCKLIDIPFPFFWGIQGKDGKIPSGQQLPANLREWSLRFDKEKEWWNGRIGETDFRIRHRELPSGETLFVGGAVTPINDSYTYYLQMNIYFGIIVISVISLILWVIFGQLLKPLKRISNIAEKIRLGKLSSRVVISEVDIELMQVGLSLNAMLDRLENTIEAHARYNSEVSHELLSPLNRITYILNEIIDKNANDDALKSKILECQVAVQKTTTLATDLLELARSEIATAHTHIWIDLEPVLDEAMEDLKKLAWEKKITIELQSLTVGVFANPTQIQQVVSNLLNNAIKFAPEKSTVYLSLKKKDGMARISVLDSGPGVAPSEVANLFQRFFRTEAAQSQEKPGHGLGLAICKNIIDQHLGTIRYERTKEGFTLFQVTLRTRSRNLAHKRVQEV